MTVKHPDITISLSDEDGNAFAILGRVNREMRRAGLSQAERAAFTKEATSGDYDHLLVTVMRWFDVQ
jgi:hypothetical protein